MGVGPVTLSVDLSCQRTVLVHASAVQGLEVEGIYLTLAALTRPDLFGHPFERDRRPTGDEFPPG